MILIYSEDPDEATTEVIDWLNHFKVNFKRINTNYVFSPIHTELSYNISNTNKSDVDITSIWYRRPGTGIDIPIKIGKNHLTSKNFYPLISRLNHSIFTESKLVLDFLLSNVNDIRQLGNLDRSEVNKYTLFKIAQRYQIDIPETIITNSKKDLLEFYNLHDKKIVIKLHDMILCSGTEQYKHYATYTEKVENLFLNKLSDYFHVSVFQELLDKEFEIRSFYLDGEFYSMAMFTQINPQTSIDFRRYNRKKMNRRVPYKLPKEIEIKLHNLMKEINLNTGSLDIVKTKSGKFVFLEVNPIGQFGFVEYSCNYYLYKKIAKYLIDDEKKRI